MGQTLPRRQSGDAKRASSDSLGEEQPRAGIERRSVVLLRSTDRTSGDVTPNEAYRLDSTDTTASGRWTLRDFFVKKILGRSLTERRHLVDRLSSRDILSGAPSSRHHIELQSTPAPGLVGSPDHDITLEEQISTSTSPIPLDEQPSCAQVLLAILFWYASSMTITGINKYVFDTLEFTYPLLVTFIHFVGIAIFLQLGFNHCWCFPPYPTISTIGYLKFIVPIALLGAGEIALSNVAYSMVSLSVMTVIKSSLVVVTYILSICFGLERFSGRLLGIVIFIMASISLTVPGLEIRSIDGVIVLCFAVFMAGGRWVIVHHQLQREHYSPTQLMLLTQPLGGLFLAAPATIIDVQDLINAQQESPDPSRLVVAAMLVSVTMTLAFLVVFAEYNLVRVTSSVSLTVAGVGKELATILMSIIAFHEELQFIPAIGIGCSVLGIICYSRYRAKALASPDAGTPNPTGRIPRPPPGHMRVETRDTDEECLEAHHLDEVDGVQRGSFSDSGPPTFRSTQGTNPGRWQTDAPQLDTTSTETDVPSLPFAPGGLPDVISRGGAGRQHAAPV